jgi:hypothetical protein
VRTFTFLRQNPFLVAAVSLPLVVVGLFLVASAIPRWVVPPPAYDCVLVSRHEPYNQARPRVAMDFAVRDGRVEATVRGLPADGYPQVPTLYLFDHKTMTVREIPVELPAALTQADPPLTMSVAALAGRRVLADARAPDGYELNSRSNRGPGIVGDLFGMRSYGDRVSLVNRGRVVRISLPGDRYGYGYGYGLSVLGWVTEGSP